MTSEIVVRLREAAVAWDGGDAEPLLSLLHEDLEWRGVPAGHLWWRRTPV